MAAPSLINRLASVFNTTTTPKTAGAFTCLAGDLLVVKATNEGAAATFGTPTGGTGTYTSRQSIGSTNSEARVQIWTCAVPTDQTITVSVSQTGTANYGVEVEQWRNHGGVGVSNGTFVGSSGAPSTTLTGVGANSAISMIIADFVAGATTGKTYRTTDAGTFTESAAAQVAGAYTYYLGYYADAGAAATKVVGMTAPSQQYSIAAVEILAGTPSSAYATAVLATSGLVSYWRHGEASGNALDSKDSNPGTTIAGGVTRAVTGLLTGDADKAVQVNGSVGSYIVAPFAANMNTGAKLSIEAWVKPNTLASGQKIVARSGLNVFYLDITATLAFRILVKDSAATTYQAFGGTPASGSTYHVVGVYDSVAQTLALYVNGVQVNSVAVGTNSLASTSDALGIAGVDGGAVPFSGIVDEVALYNTALTASQVAAHYATGIGTTVTPIPLAPSTGTASAALAIRAPTRVLLAASGGTGTGSLALQAGAPRLPLVPSTATASGNLSIVAAIPTYTPPADVPKPAVLTTAARGISTYKFELAWSADLSRIGELTQARNRSLQLALNRAGAFSCQLPLDHELTDAVAEVETCVIISRDGEVIWSGPIWTVQETVSATAASLQIGAVGWLQTLDKRVVRASWNSGQPVSYANQDAGLIALDLLTRSNADAVGAGAPTYIFPGEYELTQLRTRSYQPWSGILTAIVELTEIESGFDMVVDPATRELNVYQRVGADQGVIFELPGDVSQVNRATDSGRILNYITAYSAAGSRAEADAESISQLGLFEEAQSLSDVINTNILVAFAAGEILVKSRPLRIVTFQPLAESAERPLSPRVFRDFNIGDTVRLTVRHGRLRLNRQFLRIFSFTVGFPDTGGTAVSDIQTTMGA